MKPQPKNQTQTYENKGEMPRILRIQSFIEGRYEIRINVVNHDIELRKKGTNKPFQPINVNQLLFELYENNFSKFKEEFDVYLHAKVPQYDPFKVYFEKLPKWDNTTDYIAQLASFVRTDDQVWFERMFKKFLVRMVSQSLGKRFNKQCLCFVGKQNDGKTSFFVNLVPPSLKSYYKTGFDFSKGTKDSKIALVGSFLINLDELTQFSKHDLNAEFKAILSESTVKFRGLYEKYERAHERRASFVASTNHPEFLTDETGNVRWLPFKIKSINHDNGGLNGYASIDIDKVWAQAYALHLTNFQAEMTADEVEHQSKLNRRFFKKTYEMEVILKYFAPAQKGDKNAVFVTSTDLVDILKDKMKFSTNPIMLGRSLVGVGFEKARNESSLYGYYVIDLLGVLSSS